METTHIQDQCFEVRLASSDDIERIYAIIRQAQHKRKEEGSDQWQDGYPNVQTITDDVEKGYGYVLEVDDQIIGYVAVIFDGDPAYPNIEGQWLTEDRDYTVIHRLAVAQDVPYKGIGTTMMLAAESISTANGRYSIKVDTNHDNAPMLAVFEKLSYQYCGEVVLRGNARRKAFEKVLADLE